MECALSIPAKSFAKSFLSRWGMTPHALSKALRVTPSRINDIVNEKRGVTADTALRLSRYFGGDPQSWLNLQQTYDLKIATALAMQKIIEDIEPRSHSNDNDQALAA